MLNILFCYARENPDVSYRQGMHELLAPILFVLHSESREDIHSDDSLRYVHVSPSTHSVSIFPDFLSIFCVFKCSVSGLHVHV